ncbi:MAG: cytochrome c1 [Nitrosomonas sp.]|jgi:ubiquinol-cytochrome c reductase cytochrome c1 subunit|uniref:cytochrome c1 n=1 Tax=Nitrosomonas sp. TaxID=42353 RepID=UPI00271BF8B5|nr:cytochrome c1 [Nitrosomonas sp.]MDO8894607.1 cytochrome c1 [Nitrosomonas sp.]MDP1551332.1 cytochrome c1 [Nitrosomonas sp.]MDP1786721.1 cytochrome c1 [Nitrosomonas sp.]MDP1933888.1 cytochrome c1 [Nitrosomonas sp.]MDP2225791.1 cytochrome c1 [Nitrosomonas sp.]
MKKITIVIFILCMAPFSSLFAAESGMALDSAPVSTADNASLQRGAESFVNYCLTCHGASYMRYNRHYDIGFTNEEILTKLIFTGQKVGGLMESAMQKKEGEEWFGVAPPDLSVIARSRGADWLYTYLRAFYRDDSTATGWNNLVFDRAAMPHVFYQLQGEQKLIVKISDKGEQKTLVLDKQGEMTKAEFDNFVGDLVNYLVYLGEPHANARKELGLTVMAFLLGMLILSYALKREYWKDIH